MEQKYDKATKTYRCSTCPGVYFTKYVHLVEHIREEHGNSKDFSFNRTLKTYHCKTCLREFAGKAEVLQHISEHIPYSCPTCNKQFIELYKYSIHLSEHNDSKIYVCAECKYETDVRQKLWTHVRGVHLFHLSKYVCKECNKGFKDVSLYNDHVNQHVSHTVPECIVCKKTFPYSRYLLAHQVRQHRVFIEGKLAPNQCPTCKRHFLKQDSLQRHQEVHKPKIEKTHLCDTCGKGFFGKAKLTEHYREHTGEKPYKCDFCDKSFARSYYLTLHKRTHNGEKPYACEYCGKCFNQGAPLKVHIRTHTGDKPFRCTICEKGFPSRGAVKGHLKHCSTKE